MTEDTIGESYEKLSGLNILLCGPDLAGKSTLTSSLEKALYRAETTHSTPIANLEDPQRWAEAEKLLGAWQDELQSNMILGRHKIWDRHWLISDLIYNPQARMAQLLTAVDFLKMQYKGQRLVTLVMLLPDEGTVETRYCARGDEYFTLQEIQGFCYKYKELAVTLLHLGVPVVVLSGEVPDADEVAEICRHAETDDIMATGLVWARLGRNRKGENIDD